MLELDEVKQYLRIDGDEENTLVTSLILMATEMVEDVLRRKMSDFEVVPETVRQAVLLTVATLYENRQGGEGGLKVSELIDLIRRMTFAYRKEGF